MTEQEAIWERMKTNLEEQERLVSQRIARLETMLGELKTAQEKPLKEWYKRPCDDRYFLMQRKLSGLKNALYRTARVK
jgi:hypothetical protein